MNDTATMTPTISAAALSSHPLEDTLKQAVLSSENEERRLNKESAHLRESAERLRSEVGRSRAQAKRLRKEADEADSHAEQLCSEVERMESQTKRLRTASNEACLLKMSLQLQATCLALRRNDDATSSVYTGSFLAGCAPSLGNALLGNSKVSSLHISLETLFPADADETWPSIEDATTQVAPLAQFVETSQTLREILVDEKYYYADRVINDALVESLLGSCFRNEKMEKLTVKLNSIPAHPFAQCDGRSSSLTHLTIDTTAGYTRHDQRLIADACQTLHRYKISL